MIWKFLILMLISHSLFAETNLTSDDVVRAVGRLIANQDKILLKQKFNIDIVNSLKKEIKKLKQKQKSTNKDHAKYATVVTDSNIRSAPNIKSNIIGFAPLCSVVKIQKCEYINGSGWCKISSNAYISKKLLSFTKIEFKYNDKYKIYTKASTKDRYLVKELFELHNIQIDGISKNGRYSCLSNGNFLLNQR